MRTAAILPIKSFALAKQRLGASVEDPLRAELARAMVSDVLDALSRVRGLELTIVVTREPQAAATAAGLGALVVEDDAETGQSAAVEPVRQVRESYDPDKCCLGAYGAAPTPVQEGPSWLTESRRPPHEPRRHEE